MKHIEAASVSVHLRDVAPFPWDRMCYFGGYASLDDPKIRNSENEWVLLFFANGVAVKQVKGNSRDLRIIPPRNRDYHPCFSQSAEARTLVGALDLRRVDAGEVTPWQPAAEATPLRRLD